MTKLGFGFLRLPTLEVQKEFNYALLNEMVDEFLRRGGRYFDTAYTYLGGKSEEAIRTSLVERYPRDSFCLADKLPGWLVKEPGDLQRYFDEQCARCGVDFFDVYMLHWLNPTNYEIAERFDEFGFLRRLKEQDKAIKTGFSYHGSAELLDKILTAHPEVDIVQLQINYLDWDDPAIAACDCCCIAQKHGKEIVVMEPVKGGTLADLPDEAMAILKAHRPYDSAASWAIRFAESVPAVSVVLSGMNTLEQLRDNISQPAVITEEEKELLNKVCGVLNSAIAVPCTGCSYCKDHCPNSIPIPELFTLYNSYSRRPEDGWKISPVYKQATNNSGKASDCVSCGACEAHCPQAIKISEYMGKIASALEN